MNATPSLAEFTDRKPHRITTEMLLAMTDAGGFVEANGKVELLEGVLYEMSPQKSAHAFTKSEFSYRLQSCLRKLHSSLYAVVEPTLDLSGDSAPEPDIIVSSRARVEGFYPADVVQLAVEVALSSLKTDLEYKRLLYARAGIPEYWVVDVDGARVHRFWADADGDYGEHDSVKLGDDLASVTINGLKIATSGI